MRAEPRRTWTNGSGELCLAGRTADWEGTPGAGEEGRFDWSQTGGTDGWCEEAGARHPRTLSQHGLPGPDCPGRHQAAPGPLDVGQPEGETLGVGPVEPEVFLAAQVGSPAPGALAGGEYFMKYLIENNL